MARFARPFVFPSGRSSSSFDELAQACIEDWPSAIRLLRKGSLAAFLAGLGRNDLAAKARQAASFPNGDFGLDEVMRGWPTLSLQPAQLKIDQPRMDLGRLTIGQHSECLLRLHNEGMGFLRGTIRSDVPWLAIGDGPGGASRHFAFTNSTSISLHVQGKALRASTQPIVGRLTISSSGGEAVVEVVASVPPVPFSGGPLEGARSPRQLAEKAKANPRDAGSYFTSGAVARWYADNGWTYPIEGRPASGLAAIQQFFDALGLSAPPRLNMSEQVKAGTRGVSAPIDWLPSTNPGGVAAIPRWTPLAATPPALQPAPVGLSPAGRPTKPARLWMLAIPLGLIALLAGVGTLIAVVSSQPLIQTAESGKGGPTEDNSPDDSPTITTPPADPDPDRDVVKPPVRTIRPSVVPRPREAESGGRKRILLPQIEGREVEVVFCLDTTGSMGGLLDGAKKKIWAICNQIAGGRPTPALRVGLVAFRDKGDAYITKVTDLSRNLDSIYSELDGFMAEGGGDTPEAVNQALDDAINKIAWSRDKKTLKILFLVGDAPPHMDYTDDVKYPITCKKALERGIFINTIQCGSDSDCKKFWKDISGKAEGEYVGIPQAGGVVTVTTIHDAALTEVGKKLFDTALIHGNADQKLQGDKMVAAATQLVGATGADRVAFAAKSKRIGPFDLIDTLRARKIKLEDVKPDELPDKMKELKSAAERQAFVEKVIRQRGILYDEAIELEKKRAEALAADLARRGGAKDSFDSSVLQILRKQAKKFDIKY